MAQTLGRSRTTSGVGFRGRIPEDYWEVLGSIWRHPPTLKSNFAREHCAAIAFLSSMGWVSNITPDGTSTVNTWHVTREGVQALEGV